MFETQPNIVAQAIAASTSRGPVARRSFSEGGEGANCLSLSNKQRYSDFIEVT